MSVFKPHACLLRVACGSSNFAWRETKDQRYSRGKKNFLSNKNHSTKNGRAVCAILTRIRVSIDYADAVPFFFLNECLSLNHTLAYLEWLVVLQTLRGERPKIKDTPEVK